MSSNHNNNFPFDLSSCEKEPIHIPGTIQSHGALFFLDNDFNVLGVSANSEEFIGIPAESALGRTLQNFLKGDGLDNLIKYANSATSGFSDSRRITIQCAWAESTKLVDAVLNSSGDNKILELENTSKEDQLSLDLFYSQVKSAMIALVHAESTAHMFETLASSIRDLTGYDRVKVYQFDHDGTGFVIAESKAPFMQSFLGLRFPASDVPKQARELYLKNWTRLIADVDSKQIPIITKNWPEPIDLSYSALRSVSPVHIQYLKNMKVKGAFSISIVLNDELWGLVTCHHNEPKLIDSHRRNACEALGQIASARLISLTSKEQADEKLELEAINNKLLDGALHQYDLVEALVSRAPDIRDLTHSSSAGILRSGAWSTVGKAPDKGTLASIIEFISSHTNEIYVSSNFPAESGIREAAPHACGVLASRISQAQNDWLVWFREEAQTEVNWAGNPLKPVEVTEFGDRLNPRASFALWKETVTGTSSAWTDCEINAAKEFTHNLADIFFLLERIKAEEKLKQLNATINAQAEEAKRVRDIAVEATEMKSSFVANVSHELRTPLTGIISSAELLAMTLTEAEPKELANQIFISAQNLLRIVNDLLNFSKLEAQQAQLMPELISITDVIESVIRQANSQARVKGIEIESCIAKNIPEKIYADPTRLGQILLNFLINAVKFADRGPIEIGAVMNPKTANSSTMHLYVRDQGPGISKSDRLKLFQPFVQLSHPDTKKEPGTGLGLSICKKLAELMGGRVGCDSEAGHGATFYADIPVKTQRSDS